MNDYKELIANLREEAEAVQAIEWEIPICTDNHIREAADAIEQLIKERDTAIADLKINWLCAVCKKRVIKKEWMLCVNKDIYEEAFKAPTCSNFEWRGVKETEHETD